MKTNYKVGEEVIVNKPGINNLPGTVLSNNLDTNLKPLTVILHDGLGSWSFNYSQVRMAENNTVKADKKAPIIENKVEKRGRKKHITA
jgi:hypothetical protein